MFHIIFACTNKLGIGYNNKLPWNIPEELKLFKNITKDSVLIMGRKTVEHLPYLKDREICCITRQKDLNTKDYKNKVKVFNDILSALEYYKGKRIFVAGGSEIYKEAFRLYFDKVYVSIIKEGNATNIPNKFINFERKDFVISEMKDYDKFTHYVLKREDTEESQYLSLLENVYYNGKNKVGRNGLTRSLFGHTLRFNLQHGYPLLTTKKMFFRGIVEELLFFIRGDTNTKLLEDKKINIWRGNTNRKFLDSLNMKEREEGVMGPMYGYQWRNYNASYNEKKSSCNEKGLDQLKEVIEKIKTDPHSRRILLTDFNPLQAKQGVLYPCHSIIIQFYVEGEYLDMFCYNRSSDLFHGLPFNIASSSLFLILISKIVKLKPRDFILSLGDSHIYESHFNAVKTQLDRICYKFPKINVKKELNCIEDVEKMVYSDFELENYNYHKTIKAKMVE